MTEFKQIIGRGTRVRDDKGKLFFNILDYTGSATQMFADPDFDGEPSLVSQEEIDEAGKTVEGTEGDCRRRVHSPKRKRRVFRNSTTNSMRPANTTSRAAKSASTPK